MSGEAVPSSTSPHPEDDDAKASGSAAAPAENISAEQQTSAAEVIQVGELSAPETVGILHLLMEGAQRNYRGYRGRRQLNGLGLDASTRWVEVSSLMRRVAHNANCLPPGGEGRFV